MSSFSIDLALNAELKARIGMLLIPVSRLLMSLDLSVFRSEDDSIRATLAIPSTFGKVGEPTDLI